MMHPFKMKGYDPKDYKMHFYIVKNDLTWKDDDVVVEVTERLSARKTRTVKIRILKGALWTDDSFSRREEILVYEKKHVSDDENVTSDVCAVISQKFFEQFVSPEAPTEDITRLKELLLLPEDVGSMAYTYVTGERKPKEMNPLMFDVTKEISTMERFYKFVEPYMLPEQRAAYHKWKPSPMSYTPKHNQVKLRYLMNISPVSPLRNKHEITYDSIMKVFDEHIVGFDKMKRALASWLVENQKKARRRGVNILFHGLPGTSKTTWSKVIAMALHLPYKKIELGDIGSTVSLSGCEGPYGDSIPGIIIDFFFDCKSSECVLCWDELDKLANMTDQNRGKDGHVMESLLPLLDSDKRVWEDTFMEKVPINCENIINIATANRLENISPELLNRFDAVFSIEPYDEEVLMKILRHKLPSIQEEYSLNDDWIEEEALHRLLRYRTDFGGRDILAGLKKMAAFSRENKGKVVTARHVDDVMPELIDIHNDMARFHMNEQRYSKKQKEEILETVKKRMSAQNLSPQECRALDLKIHALTKLMSDEVHVFDPDVFFECANEIYGNDEVKNMIAADLYALSRSKRHPEVICLVGPAGVGKTSLVEAIANATGRKYIRIQMSGVKDSDYLLGHIPEQVAANPGKIVREMVKKETTRPLLYFDELEKISQECQNALFEMFDDEPKISDRFLSFPVDLSNTQIICSSNDLRAIHPALLSRMKVVYMRGYTSEEKLIICKKHLIPKLNVDLEMNDDTLRKLLEYYQTDAGVRGIKHALNTVVNRCMLEQRKKNGCIQVKNEDIKRILGENEYVYVADTTRPGCVNGLATMGDSRGMVMPIKVTLLRNGEKRVTGLPETSIKDSIAIAETWIETEYGISLKEGYHFRFLPAGIAKDGPSAGLSVAIALLSAALGAQVGNVAMSGEFDGNKVLPVGGLDLKVQAALSSGIKKVFLPEGCRKDIDQRRFKGLDLIFVEDIDDVVKELFPTLKKGKTDIKKMAC